MKAFDNYEIWWVTGAQLLYGGDAVVAVDGHSKEMVEGLNKSGNIPVKIVYKGTANSSKERRYHHLDAHLLTRKDVDQGSAAAAEAPPPLPHTI